MQTHYISKYSRPIRYILFIFSLVFLVFTIKVVLNLSEIDKRINQIKIENSDYQEKDNYMKFFYQSYLSGEKVQFFRSHENATIFSGEKIVRFSRSIDFESLEDTSDTEDVVIKEEVLNISKPSDSWDYFLRDKWIKLKEQF